MNEDQFWNIIEKADGDPRQMVTHLSKCQPSEIVSFHDIFRLKVRDAYQHEFMMACFVIMSYISDDSFESFRAWVVVQGLQKFAAAIKDPESFCNWLKPEDVGSIDGDPFLEAAARAYRKVGGTNRQFDSEVVELSDPVVSTKLPERKSAYREAMPGLVEKFWNMERIRELHGR